MLKYIIIQYFLRSKYLNCDSLKFLILLILIKNQIDCDSNLDKSKRGRIVLFAEMFDYIQPLLIVLIL